MQFKVYTDMMTLAKGKRTGITGMQNCEREMEERVERKRV